MTEDELETIKRRVQFSPGANTEQRERWYIIMQLEIIKKQLAAAVQGRAPDKT